jgi:hypothetical protein
MAQGFFAKNINRTGRILRASYMLILLTLAVFVPVFPVPVRILLALSGLFAGFEAAKGWCLLRACGIKTKY